jgi:hypothetical protein
MSLAGWKYIPGPRGNAVSAAKRRLTAESQRTQREDSGQRSGATILDFLSSLGSL